MPDKRILCVTSSFPRWAGDSVTPFVLNLAQDLQQQGWQVDVLAPLAPNALKSETIDGVYVERFQYMWPASQQTVCYNGGALNNLQGNRLNFLKTPFLVLAQWLAVMKRLSTGRYVLVHSHWLIPQGFTAAIAAKIFKVPHVTTVHGGDIFALKNRFFNQFKRFVLRYVDRVTVNSSVTKAAVQKFSVADDKIQRIPMGVKVSSLDEQKDDKSAQKNALLGQTNHFPIMLFVGRIVDGKGVDDFLLSIQSLKSTYPNVLGVVIGDGQERAQREAQAKALALNEQVVFTGWLEPAAITQYWQIADVFINPSKQAKNGWIEAQGVSILEAMAQDVAVIATRQGGVVDSVKHEKTGLLVEPAAPEQIAAAVTRLFSEQDLAQRLILAAKKSVREDFSREASAQAFSGLFQQLLAEKTS